MFEGRTPTDTVWDLVSRRATLSGDERASLGRFKVPEEYRVVEALPRTSIGKVEKKTLRALL